MTSKYLHRVLAAVQTLTLRGEPLTTRTIQRAMGLQHRTSSGTVSEALAVLRELGYISYADRRQNTLRYTEPRLYE